MRSTFAFVALTWATVACSGSNGTSAAPSPDGGAAADAAVSLDAGADSAAPDASAEAGGAVQLVDTTPADAALHVGVLTIVTLHYSGSLASSSVSTTSVKLVSDGGTVALPASVSYDDTTHTITLKPLTALSADLTYRITTTSLLAADNSPVANVTRSFHTRYNSYTDYESLNGTTLTSYTSYTLDAQGRVARRITMAKGADMVFGTADDVPTQVAAYTYGPGTQHLTNYSGPGVDAVWFTADDVISNTNDYDTTTWGRTRSVYHSGSGVDGVWGTADDVIGTFYESVMSPEGREAHALDYAGPGPDGVPFTADDVMSYRFADTWTANSGQRIQYSAAGPDGVWLTADDVISTVNDYVLDSLGRITALTFRGKGADGIFLTSDDVTTQAWTRIYDGKGLLTQFRIVNGAGIDGVWLTNDDVVSSYYGYAYDTSAALLSRTSYTAGPDGLWFTADDVAIYIEHMSTTL